MNRVILCGRLTAPPQITYTGGGSPVATFQLRVPREGSRDLTFDPCDPIDCVARGKLAIELHTWGEAGVRVNLEGRLRREEYSGEDGERETGPRVHVDHAYCADPAPMAVGVYVHLLPREEPEGSVSERVA